MKLVNRTPVDVRAHLGATNAEGHRLGMLIAKATFAYAPGAGPELVDDPQPVFYEETPTPDGLMPADVLPRVDDEFEVIFLGAAYGPGGRMVTQRDVRLAVGAEARSMRVFGDRHWVPTESGWVPSEPAPFARMPLVWERAYGGSEEIEVDETAFATFAHQRNPAGRGYDPGPEATGLARLLGAPDEFPRLPLVRRFLPNLEDPAEPVRAYDQRPWPYCWATCPSNSTLPSEAAVAVSPDGTTIKLTSRLWCRSHPCWIIDRPLAAAPVELTGLDPDHERVRFALPRLRVIADYALGRANGRRELIPHRLVLCGDTRRFTLLYRRRIALAPNTKAPLHLRIRLAEGWRAHPTRTA